MDFRLYRLLEKHQRLDEELRREQRRCRPDPFRLRRLWGLKLRVKEIIHRFTLKAARA